MFCILGRGKSRVVCLRFVNSYVRFWPDYCYPVNLLFLFLAFFESRPSLGCMIASLDVFELTAASSDASLGYLPRIGGAKARHVWFIGGT